MQNICFITPNWPAPSNVKALTTLRCGGNSQGPYFSFNLAAHVGDNEINVKQNRQYLQKMAGFKEEPCWIKQVHGIKAIQITQEINNNFFPEADASFTVLPNKVAAVLTADCLPILISNTKGTEVAAIHAGWRGLANGIIEATIAQLKTDRSELIAWLGPAISQKAFIVGEEVKNAFSKPFDEKAFIPCESTSNINKNIIDKNQNFFRADLYLLAKFRLLDLGIQNIYGGEYCTYTDEDRFYSYRRSIQTGRMANLIWIDK